MSRDDADTFLVIVILVLMALAGMLLLWHVAGTVAG